jgi:peptidoglycan/xylan/chitin deacetylase (PgdA/CDA1 family)
VPVTIRLGTITLRQTAIRTGLESLYFSGAHAALRPVLGGLGAILTLHHVRPGRTDAFQPNRLLEVTPEFLEEVIVGLRSDGFEFVTLDEAIARLSQGAVGRRFVTLTFDDGYRDNVEHALPILRRHGVPMTMYVCSAFAAGTGELWWLTLEEVIAANARVDFVLDDQVHHLDAGDPDAKQAAFERIYWLLRALPRDEQIRAAVNELAQRYGIDPVRRSAELCLRWPEIATLSQDPLVTIGAHTITHPMLRKVSAASARREMQQSAANVEKATGKRVEHFCYPVGDASAAGPGEFEMARELGFKSAVTTRPGVLFPDHRDHLWALPRISLNGDFQRMRYVRVLTSGAATAVWNRFRRVNVG